MEGRTERCRRHGRADCARSVERSLPPKNWLSGDTRGPLAKQYPQWPEYGPPYKWSASRFLYRRPDNPKAIYMANRADGGGSSRRYRDHCVRHQTNESQDSTNRYGFGCGLPPDLVSEGRRWMLSFRSHRLGLLGSHGDCGKVPGEALREVACLHPCGSCRRLTPEHKSPLPLRRIFRRGAGLLNQPFRSNATAQRTARVRTNQYVIGVHRRSSAAIWVFSTTNASRPTSRPAVE